MATKIVIFTGMGGFHIPDIVGWHLIIHNGWKIVDNKECPDIYKKELYDSYNDEFKFSWSERFYTNHYWDKELRMDTDIVEAFTLWNPEDFKVIELPDDLHEWYIDEGEMGGETIHEEHRSWG